MTSTITGVCVSKKSKYNMQHWKTLIKDQKNSGMRVVDWCIANGVTKHAIYYWLVKVRDDEFESTMNALPAPVSSNMPDTFDDNTFVELSNNTSGNQHCLEINKAIPDESRAVAVIKKGDIQIELLPSATSSFINELIEAIRYV